MQGSLGEKTGNGAFAEFHAWAPARVVKLLKDGVLRRVAWEARTTRAVFAAGTRGVRRGDPGGALRHRADAP